MKFTSVKPTGFATHIKRGMVTSLACLLLASPLFSQSTKQKNDEEANEEETVILTPFVVTADKDDSYLAVDTLAGNRTRINLSDIGSSVSVVTKKFMEDTNSKKAADLLVLTTNTEVGGQAGNFLGKGNGVVLTDPEPLNPPTRVRGLAGADFTRGFFLTSIPFDLYNTGRIDIQRGPNSLLFGIGSPGGIINATPNEAMFTNSNKVEGAVATYGSTRFSADFNRVLLSKELAVRVALLEDDTKYRQDPAYRNDTRVYGTVKWQPKFLNKGSAHTTFSANAESVKIRGVAPLNTPPLDAITPYFDTPYFKAPDGSLITYAATGEPYSASGQVVQMPPNPWFTTSPAYTSGFTYTAFEPGGSQGMTFYGSGFQWPDITVPNAQDPTPVTGGYFGITTYNFYANNAKLPGSSIGAYKAKSLTDRSIFDFYNNLIGGPNSSQLNEFDTYTFDLTQTFLNNRIGFNLAYNHEKAYLENYSFLSSYSTAISIDIMRTLANGQANPNVGRPYVIGGGQSGYGSWTRAERDTVRLTGYAEFDFKDVMKRGSLWARVLGRHVFTGALERYKTEADARAYQSTYIEYDTNNWQSLSPENASTSASVNALIYLGPRINNLSSAKNIGLDRVTGRINFSPTTELIYNNVLKEFVRAPINVLDNRAQPNNAKYYSSANRTKDQIDSGVISWQGHFLDGALISLVGVRKDEADAYLQQAPRLAGTPWINTMNNVYQLGDTPIASVKGTSRTYSLVARLPEELRRRWTPWFEVGLFANQSENFQPAASRIDLYGDGLPSPTGKTKEFGVTFSAFDKKLYLKVTRFKTTISDTSVSQTMPLGGAIIAYAWGQAAYHAFENPNIPVPFSFLHSNYGTTSDGHVLNFEPPGNAPFTQEQIDAMYAVQKASMAAWKSGAQLPESIQRTFGMVGYNDPATYAANFTNPPNLAVTADTVSEGEEFEIYVNPLKGLYVTANLSHVKAQQTNIGKTFTDFMDRTAELFNGPAGDMQIFADNSMTARQFFQENSVPQYNLMIAQQGSATPELCPWRFNGTATYIFMDGPLKGVTIGGSYRWEDRTITGYPVITKDGLETYDIGHPYKGPHNDAVDLWIGYEIPLGKKIIWRTQLNVRNLFAKDDLQVVTTQPDGSPAAMRIPEPRVFTWTNTFTF